MVERAVQSILNQPDPIGTEVVVVEDGEHHGVVNHLQTIFSGEILGGRLSLKSVERQANPARLKNIGAAIAKGKLLAFLDPEDQWHAGRLENLDPLLGRHELILGSDDSQVNPANALEKLYEGNWIIPGSAIIQRQLFERLRGFHEGNLLTARLPRNWLATSGHELWARALAELQATKQTERLCVLSSGGVVFDESPQTNALVQSREFASLLRAAGRLPAHTWPQLGRKILERLKSRPGRR